MIRKIKLENEEVYETADKLYWLFLESLEEKVADTYVETDPDVENGTRNTEKGKELYFGIESVLEELWMKKYSGDVLIIYIILLIVGINI